MFYLGWGEKRRCLKAALRGKNLIDSGRLHSRDVVRRASQKTEGRQSSLGFRQQSRLRRVVSF